MMTVFWMVSCFLMFVLCILLVFVFDDIVLNKHFTKKLHRQLGVDGD
jgi:hypothetical protein